MYAMVETVSTVAHKRAPRVVLFDFDGTLSLVRSGWIGIMTDLFLRHLLELQTGETEQSLRAVIGEFIWRLTGKETIYQMEALVEEIRKRGGTPKDAVFYKEEYLDRLNSVVRGRIAELKQDEAAAEKYLVPGARVLLESLRARGMRLYLASGTDDEDVKNELSLLRAADYFEGRVWGAVEGPGRFAKQRVVRAIIEEEGYRGDEILAFGDGSVEIELTRQVGGIAVGLATDEPDCEIVDPWKRERLIGAGADYIIPNYKESAVLLPLLFPEPVPAAV